MRYSIYLIAFIFVFMFFATSPGKANDDMMHVLQGFSESKKQSFNRSCVLNNYNKIGNYPGKMEVEAVLKKMKKEDKFDLGVALNSGKQSERVKSLPEKDVQTVVNSMFGYLVALNNC